MKFLSISLKISAKNLAQSSDEELMQLVGRGNSPAFDELYARYSRRLLWYFTKMLGGDEERAQDCLQDVFLKIVERPELFKTDRNFSTWIFSIAHNMCKNEFRRRENALAEIAETDDFAADENMEIVLEREEFRTLLLKELDELDDELRTTFLLRYMENFSIREISNVLQCPEGTVKSRLFNTAKKLAQRLKMFDPNAIPVM